MTGDSGQPAGRRPEDADAALDAAFLALRAAAPRPSAALMGRVLSDAAAVAASAAAAGARAPHRRTGGLAALVAAIYRGLGGAPAAAGLAAATLAGVWIGASPPAVLAGLADSVWATPAEVDIGGFFDPAALTGIDPGEAG